MSESDSILARKADSLHVRVNADMIWTMTSKQLCKSFLSEISESGRVRL